MTVGAGASDSGKAPNQSEQVDGMPVEFGRYRILRKLGAGGMGAVYLADDTELGRKVALKTPSFGQHEDTQIIKRFAREAKAASKIDHPNVCPVYEFGEFSGRHYLTMGFIEGQELSEWVQLQDDISVEQALSIVKRLALGLHAAHQVGIVHRDLKPGNVMITEELEPVILDFGMVRMIDVDQTILTPTGTMVGTPASMAPEQILGDRDAINATTDLYSLGVILYELLTGWPPFSGSLTTLLGTIVSDAPPRLESHRADLDPRLNDLCLRALEKDQRMRYQTGEEMAVAIDAFLAGDAPVARVDDAAEQVPAPSRNLFQRLWKRASK